MQLLSNEKKIYLMSFISNMRLFYAPIIFLFYKNFDINIVQIGIIFAINSIITLLFEIPFGLFSDKYSSKLSVLIGYFSYMIGIIIFLIGNNYYQFIAGNIFISIGDAGVSGAATVLFMPYLKNSDNIFDITSISRGYANIIGGLIIGFIYNINIKLPFLISLILSVWNFINYFILKEIKMESDEKENVKNEYKKSNSLLNKNIFFTIKSNIFILFLLLICYISIPQIMVYFPEYMAINNFKPEYLGIIYMIANIFSLLGAKIHKKYMSHIPNIKKLKDGIFFIMILSLLLALVKNVWLGVIFYLLLRIVTGWFYQLFYRYVNSNSPENHKSTMFSIISVVMELAFIVSDPIIALIISKYSIYMTYLFASISSLIMIGLILVIEKNKNI